MWRWRGLLLALLLCGGCAAAIPTDALRDVLFTVESLDRVYLVDGAGESAIPIFGRRQSRDEPGRLDRMHDGYLAPSLSPDHTRVACLRFRNSSPHPGSPDLEIIQSVEVVLVQVADETEHVVTSVPRTRSGVLLAPVWSPDGTRVFFAEGHRVWSYVLGAPTPEPIADIPAEFSGSFTLRRYLRPSRDGRRLFGLLERTNRRFGRYDVIVSIDLGTRELTPLWTGNLSRGSVFEIDPPVPRDIEDDVASALFGSRERPVYTPTITPDGRFYFFGRHEMGLFGREWVAGYDRATRTEFEVRTMWRTFFWK